MLISTLSVSFLVKQCNVTCTEDLFKFIIQLTPHVNFEHMSKVLYFVSFRPLIPGMLAAAYF